MTNTETASKGAKKQLTAVEYLYEAMTTGDWEATPWPKRREIVERAKQMEREQNIFWPWAFED